MDDASGLSPYLNPARYIDSDHPAVIAFAERWGGGEGPALVRVLALFNAVRDEILYDPYVPMGDPESYRASSAIARGRGFCVPKAALLAACCRHFGIPARVGYGDVKNHLATKRLTEWLESDIYTWHSYAEILLDGNWVKATPAFNKAMCEKFGVLPLEFDGKADCLFHPYDRDGRQHMEYLRHRGVFTDVPYETIVEEFRRLYPKALSAAGGIGGDFQAEAGAA
jgi:transglutaminase-like putative cysteine protease